MTTPMLMTQHPTEELLAAFVDDRLDSAAREPVTDHLASCGECREIVLMTTAFQASEPVPVPVPHRFGRRRMAAIASLAAAAVIALAVVPPMLGPDVDDLVAIAQTVKERPSDGRTAGGFPYSEPPPSITRSARPTGNDLNGKWKYYDIYDALEKKKSPDPHVFGLNKLLIAEKSGEFSNAVTMLETAYEKTSGDERDSVATDLAAALIARARFSGEKDYERALDLSNEVLKRQPKSPEALWNRAIALQSITLQDGNRTAEALRAWDDYLKVENHPQWVEEATRRKARIESDF